MSLSTILSSALTVLSTVDDRPYYVQVTSPEEKSPPRRRPLTPARVVEGAIELADAEGLAGLTMRNLATHLGVKPMALYHHIATKELVLDAMVDAVYAQIELPPADRPWAAAMRQRSASAREVLRRHPWALTVINSRVRPGPATLRHNDAVLGCLYGAGLSHEQVAHAVSLIDAYVFGFVLQETSLPFTSTAESHSLATQMLADVPVADDPHMAALMTGHVMRPDYLHAAEFDHGLGLVLHALDPLGAGPTSPARGLQGEA
jgi:AcrR family transcriptional regulator